MSAFVYFNVQTIQLVDRRLHYPSAGPASLVLSCILNPEPSLPESLPNMNLLDHAQQARLSGTRDFF